MFLSFFHTIVYFLLFPDQEISYIHFSKVSESTADHFVILMATWLPGSNEITSVEVGSGVGVSVGTGVNVPVGILVSVGVKVTVLVGVLVGVRVSVGVNVRNGV